MKIEKKKLNKHIPPVMISTRFLSVARVVLKLFVTSEFPVIEEKLIRFLEL